MKSALKWTVLCATSVMLAGFEASAAAPNQGSRLFTQSQHTFRAGKLIGTEAKDSQGKGLGDVKDFTLNPQTGEMFCLIDIGGGRWATVPWQLVKVTTDGKGNLVVTVNAAKAVLQGAPSVTKDQWNSLQDPSYTQRVYSYFQIQPSGVGAPGSMTGQQQGGAQSGQGQQQQGQQTEQQKAEQQKLEQQKAEQQRQQQQNQGQQQPQSEQQKSEQQYQDPNQQQEQQLQNQGGTGQGQETNQQNKAQRSRRAGRFAARYELPLTQPQGGEGRVGVKTEGHELF